MNIIEQSHEIIQKPQNPLWIVEQSGRTCYKSEDRISDGSAVKFSEMLLNRNHESVFEHVVVSVRFITNRGVTHELVRHRLAAYSQESTRYVKYDDNNMEFIKPVWWNDWSKKQQKIWMNSLEESERAYIQLMNSGASAQQAREVLPNSLKTEIVVTANLREWRHIFDLRCSKKAHPQMRQLMIKCCIDFRNIIPVIFEDIVL